MALRPCSFLEFLNGIGRDFDVDVIQNFKPTSTADVDYFLMVSSNVKSDTLYHDSNGFLVAKRLLNKRPDYEFKVVKEDKINSNTYPVCSFAFFMEENKKFLFFADRAHGVASFNQNLLINIDRITMDDGKGVGEGYTLLINNTFRHKFAIISSNDNTERVWQRNYDEALLGYISNDQSRLIKYRAMDESETYSAIGIETTLKYSLFYLNEN
jgi:hypothetical protein